MSRTPIRASEVGLGETRPGHELGQGTKSDSDSAYAHFDCTCGMRFLAKLRQTDGRAGAEAQRHWERHLALADADPNIIFEVGTVTIKKGMKKIFVAPRHWVGTDQFTHGRFNGWASGNYSGGKGWGVFSEAPWCKEVLEVTDTKEQAFTAALRILDVAEKRGSKVNRQCDSYTLPDSETARTVMAALLGLPGTDIADMELAIAALEEVLQFVPLLQQKHQQLVTTREQTLLAPILRRAPAYD